MNFPRNSFKNIVEYYQGNLQIIAHTFARFDWFHVDLHESINFPYFRYHLNVCLKVTSVRSN